MCSLREELEKLQKEKKTQDAENNKKKLESNKKFNQLQTDFENLKGIVGKLNRDERDLKNKEEVAVEQQAKK